MEKIISQTEKILQLRNYSPKTRKAYILYIRQYIIFSKNNALKNKQQAVEMFLLDKYDKKQSPQTVYLALNAIKFFYSEIMQDSIKIDLKFAKRQMTWFKRNSDIHWCNPVSDKQKILQLVKEFLG